MIYNLQYCKQVEPFTKSIRVILKEKYRIHKYCWDKLAGNPKSNHNTYARVCYTVILLKRFITLSNSPVTISLYQTSYKRMNEGIA